MDPSSYSSTVTPPLHPTSDKNVSANLAGFQRGNQRVHIHHGTNKKGEERFALYPLA